MAKKKTCISRRKFIAASAATSAATLASRVDEKRDALPATSIGQSINAGRNRVITIPAKPERVEIDTATSAVVVVDMQNDFATKGGMLDRAGMDISSIQRSIGPIAAVLTCARDAGMKIVYLKMGFHPDLSDLGRHDSPNRMAHLRSGVGKTVAAPNGTESRILIRDTWNTDIVPELKPHDEDIVLYKTRFSGFYETELDATLKRHAVKNLIVTGCTTSVCVESTVRDAMFRDYRCVLLNDCMAEVVGDDLPRTNHEASLFLIQSIFGWVTDSDQFLRALKT